MHAARGQHGNGKLALRARLVVFAIVLAMFALAVNGASWMIEHPAADELAMARSVLDRVSGPELPVTCADRNAHPDKGEAL